MDSTIRQAAAADLPYILALAKRFSRELGFIPRAGVEDYLARGWINIALQNGQAAGYLLTRPKMLTRPGVCRITQAAIQYDAQGQRLGAMLVDSVIAQAQADGQSVVSCRCLPDIAANDFWRAMGFEIVGTIDNHNRKLLPLNVWAMHLSPLADSLFADDSYLLRQTRRGLNHPQTYRRKISNGGYVTTDCAIADVSQAVACILPVTSESIR